MDFKKEGIELRIFVGNLLFGTAQTNLMEFWHIFSQKNKLYQSFSVHFSSFQYKRNDCCPSGTRVDFPINVVEKI